MPGRVILSTRSLMPVYNPQTILDAFGMLAEELEDVQLVVKHMGVVTMQLGRVPHPERVHFVDNVLTKRVWRSIALTYPSAKNPTARPSGDQKGCVPYSVPRS